MTVIEKYEKLYLHDSSIRQINLDVWDHICTLDLSYAGVMRESEKAFDYELFYKPATLKFTEVKEINCPEGYCMKTEILSHEVTVTDEYPGYFCFSIILAEGKNRDTFTTTINIIARDFLLNGTVSEFPPVA
jgi:hypothetical protein